jgi:hypothetical protein
VLPTESSEFLAACGRQVVIPVMDLSAGGYIESTEDIQQCGLPAARRTKNDDKFSWQEVQCDAAKRVH